MPLYTLVLKQNLYIFLKTVWKEILSESFPSSNWTDWPENLPFIFYLGTKAGISNGTPQNVYFYFSFNCCLNQQIEFHSFWNAIRSLTHSPTTSGDGKHGKIKTNVSFPTWHMRLSIWLIVTSSLYLAMQQKSKRLPDYRQAQSWPLSVQTFCLCDILIYLPHVICKMWHGVPMYEPTLWKSYRPLKRKAWVRV
jgi:hypothetical protein